MLCRLPFPVNCDFVVPTILQKEVPSFLSCCEWDAHFVSYNSKKKKNLKSSNTNGQYKSELCLFHNSDIELTKDVYDIM